MTRYVRTGNLAPSHYARTNGCRYCGNMRFGRPQDCPEATCLMCGSTQCFYNGSGNGQCGICYVGLLPGWSGSSGQCTYKNCDETAVARGRGKKMVCRAHAERQKIGTPNLESRYGSMVMSRWEMVA